MRQITASCAASLLCLVIAVSQISCQPIPPVLAARAFPAEGEMVLYASSKLEIEENRAFFRQLFEGETFSIKWDELDAFQRGAAPSERKPYQDSWYPYSTGGTNINGALSLYDRAFHGGVSRAVAWETSNHSSTKERWYGHCNGSSVSSIRYASPQRSVFRPAGCTRGRAGCIEFDPAAIRALLAEINMNVTNKFLGGARCDVHLDELKNRPRVSYTSLDDCDDLNAGIFHVVLINYLGRMSQPIIHDQAYDQAVWNFPIYSYAYESQDISQADAARLAEAPTSNWVFNPQAKAWKYITMGIGYRYFEESFAGAGTVTPAKGNTLTYILELDGSGQIIGGEWVGASKKNHPDFIWIPFEPERPIDDRRLSNPYVNSDEVLRLWAESVGRNPNAPFAEDGPSSRVLFYPRDRELREWGLQTYYQILIDGRRSGATFVEPQKEIDLTLAVRDDLLKSGSSFVILLNGRQAGKSDVVNGRGSVKLKPRVGLNIVSVRWSTSAMDTGSLDRDFHFYAM